MYTLIQTARLNDVDPQAWLADVLNHISDHNIRGLDQLLPWNWKTDHAELADRYGPPAAALIPRSSLSGHALHAMLWPSASASSSAAAARLRRCGRSAPRADAAAADLSTPGNFSSPPPASGLLT
jgi:hypothetical protein